MSMRAIKVSEATNAQLDWLVAKCEGAKGLRMHTYAGIDPGPPCTCRGLGGWLGSTRGYRLHHRLVLDGADHRAGEAGPSLYGGRCKPSLLENRSHRGGTRLQKGRHPLIAAARCYVTSKLGETVEVPKELV